MKSWISAIRPRTLPLAVSGILMGTFPAMIDGSFETDIFLLAMLTAIFLQILSNLANDYGDFVKGTDVAGSRSDRALASGRISSGSMRKALILMVIITLGTGIWLIYRAFGSVDLPFLLLLLTGLLAIAAAIRYTVGSKAYGYRGLGDLAVLIFFGYVAVCGCYYLYSTSWEAVYQFALLPATGMGLLCVGVLNINNIRDINPDRMNGKRTFAVILGRKGALIYQALLLLVAFTAFNLQWWGVENVNPWIYLLTLPLYAFHTYKLATTRPNDVAAHHRLLKLFVLLTLAFVCLYGIAILQ